MRILFVCTGNTCRSPMAEAAARDFLRRRSAASVEVESAGTAASAGVPASPHALQVAREAGLDLSGHRSRPLTRQALRRASLVLVMGAAHAAQVHRMDPEAPTFLLTEYAQGVAEEVLDPLGGDLQAYRNSLSRIRPLVVSALQRFQRELGRERI